ncbi:hypothetical protein CAPTEDRAFT_184940 [Capitella teleta]|uniref:VWFA domain-containing protein n=1 Tax=Capitella teleta TaxID=283909 RepID=R7U1H0_CAPTE|nr:hypothetical protein CAPTEDRAFT_184940 [Capitella teleta]|eukprot:ELT99722.1 hypothetical protein CAPTEDRAFT_184940 [Capitella teleta]
MAWINMATFLLLLVFGGVGARVTFSDNAYNDVLVYIHPDVHEDDRLLDNIKKTFTSASALLHRASRNHFYFGAVTIYIPHTWTAKKVYEDVVQESRDNMDVLIEPSRTDGDYDDHPSNAPFTPNFKGCKQMGEYIHLTNTFMVNDIEAAKYGPREKARIVLVHEWAHYRFGIFDEYPQPSNPLFYVSSEGKIEATRCSLAIKVQFYNNETEEGCDIVNGLPEKACRFRENSDATDSSFGSLMYKQNIDQITEFCTDDSTGESLHNREAPNNQNDRCGSQSAWEIIRAHDDFINSKAKSTIDTTPQFRVVKKKNPPKIVLVLDLSGSMNYSSKLIKLRQGCYSFLSYTVSECSEVGIIEFSTTAKTKQNLTRIGEKSRVGLVNALPSTATGVSTSIGSGLIEALKMLGDYAYGSHIIVVSDGEENEKPKIPEVKEEVLCHVIKSRAIVHSIAITQNASADIDQLSHDTGGQSYIVNPDNTESLNAKFKNIGKSAADSCHQEIASDLVNQQIKIPGGKPKLKKAFVLDASLGRDLLIIFQFESNDFLIKISSPNGNPYSKHSEEFSCSHEFMACHFLLAHAEPGVWTIEFSTSGESQTITYTVEAKAADPSVEPIEAEILWKSPGPQNISSVPEEPQKLYAKVKQGNLPIIDASVRAIVETPTGEDIRLNLADNGVGPDAIANDGVYSADFVSYTSAGRYQAKASVEGSGSTTTNKNGIVGFGEISGANNPEASKKTGSFSRTQTSQSIQVVHYNPDPSGKLYPPARISDLKVTRVDQSNFTATLEWTAVGEQASIGQDEEYYVIGIVVIDEKNRSSTSTISNLAHISFTTIPDTIIDKEEEEEMIPTLYIIIGCASCVLVALVTVAIVANIKCRRTNEISPEEPQEVPYVNEQPEIGPPPPTPPPPAKPQEHWRNRGVRVMF